MSAHTKKMILLVNVSSNDDKSETSDKRKEKLCIGDDLRIHEQKWREQF